MLRLRIVHTLYTSEAWVQEVRKQYEKASENKRMLLVIIYGTYKVNELKCSAWG